ncbi:MAG TPA: thioesterase family protein [Methylomirabilota bacterium]|nr:thioesterase family protein [Methylomirabilota bacterium]
MGPAPAAPAMTDQGWLETHRGTVSRWEVDHVDHFTVAYYVERFEHAARALLDALGLGPRDGRACVTVDGYVRYLRELRAGDVLHVVSGVLGVDEAAVRLGHKLLSSERDAVCATFEQRVRRVALDTGAPVGLDAAQRRAAAARQVAWDGPPREARATPADFDRVPPSARDTIRPAEVDVLGRAPLAAFVHRFSAGSGQLLSSFGMTPSYQREQRRGFSTFEFQLEVTGALRAGDHAVVRSALLHVGNSSLHTCHALADGRTGARVATLHQLGVHLDMDARRPAPLPDALREKARALVAGAEGG